MGIKIFSFVDTDCNPDLIDHAIPGNDDALRSIRLFVSRIADAVLTGRGLKEAANADEANGDGESVAATDPTPSPSSAAPA